jgi:hypothetical protein
LLQQGTVTKVFLHVAVAVESIIAWADLQSGYSLRATFRNFDHRLIAAPFFPI